MKSNNSSKSVKKNNKRNKNSNNKTILSKGGAMNKTSTSASYEVSIENPTRFEITGKGLDHSEYGSALRAVGRQQLVTLATTATNNNLFVTGVATATTANFVQIVPSSLNDRVLQIAALYQRYAFRSIEFVYVTRVATTQAGSFAMAYSTDGGFGINSGDEPTLSFAGLQDVEPCKVLPFRKEIETLRVSYSGSRTWYVDNSTSVTTLEGYRQNVQGVLAGFPDLTSIGVVNQGEIYMSYVLDLYVPTQIPAALGLFHRIPKNHRASFLTLIKKYSESKDKEEFLKSLEKVLQVL
jgi:hypothetical protein